mgnify:CR=1 FL=1
MIIWILDCATCYCTKVHLSDEKEKELDEKYDGSVQDFLTDHENELGINMNYCSFMLTCDDKFDVIEF